MGPKRNNIPNWTLTEALLYQEASLATIYIYRYKEKCKGLGLIHDFI